MISDLSVFFQNARNATFGAQPSYLKPLQGNPYATLDFWCRLIGILDGVPVDQLDRELLRIFTMTFVHPNGTCFILFMVYRLQ